MPTNIQRTNYSLYSQNVFQTSVSKFLHIDFTFRTVNDANANACVMNDTSNMNSNVRFQEYIIRFYRICQRSTTLRERFLSYLILSYFFCYINNFLLLFIVFFVFVSLTIDFFLSPLSPVALIYFIFITFVLFCLLYTNQLNFILYIVVFLLSFFVVCFIFQFNNVVKESIIIGLKKSFFPFVPYLLLFIFYKYFNVCTYIYIFFLLKKEKNQIFSIQLTKFNE